MNYGCKFVGFVRENYGGGTVGHVSNKHYPTVILRLSFGYPSVIYRLSYGVACCWTAMLTDRFADGSLC